MWGERGWIIMDGGVWQAPLPLVCMLAHTIWSLLATLYQIKINALEVTLPPSKCLSSDTNAGRF